MFNVYGKSTRNSAPYKFWLHAVTSSGQVIDQLSTLPVIANCLQEGLQDIGIFQTNTLAILNMQETVRLTIMASALNRGFFSGIGVFTSKKMGADSIKIQTEKSHLTRGGSFTNRLSKN